MTFKKGQRIRLKRNIIPGIGDRQPAGVVKNASLQPMCIVVLLDEVISEQEKPSQVIVTASPDCFELEPKIEKDLPYEVDQ